MTHLDVARELADENGGAVRVRDVIHFIVKHGMTEGTVANLRGSVYRRIANSDDFEKVGPGVFRVRSAACVHCGGTGRVATAPQEPDDDR